MKPPKITITTSENETIEEFSEESVPEGDDSLTSALSLLYGKFLIILGITLPITQLLTNKVPNPIYQSFYIYLYAISILFVLFIYGISICQSEEYSKYFKFNLKFFWNFTISVKNIHLDKYKILETFNLQRYSRLNRFKLFHIKKFVYVYIDFVVIIDNLKF